jgi:LmbE family N-acetylglucosaminyl deacetylase
MTQGFKNILAIGAHPDDIEFSCLGYLLKLKSSGANIISYIASMGCKGDPTSGLSRIEESKQALKNVTNDVYYNERSGIELSDYETLSVNIRNIILTNKPDLILIHSQHDTHQEHKYLRDIVITAARRFPCTIFSYKSVSVTASYMENIFVDVTKEIEEKIRYISFHKSQSHHEYMSEEFIREYHVSWFGKMHGMRYVESYYVEQLIY